MKIDIFRDLFSFLLLVITQHFAMKRPAFALLIIIGLFSASKALLCNPANPDFATSIIYVGYPDSTITFDDLGFNNNQPWSSASGSYTLYDNNGQTISVSGTSCEIMFGTQNLGLAAWNSSGDWQYFPTYHPGYFMALKSEAGSCEFNFNPPIAEFAFRYNTNASPVGTLHIYDHYNHLISCSKMIQNPGYNYYNYTGFTGLVEIQRVVVSSGLTVLDDFKWTKGCGETGVYDWQTCQPMSRCDDLKLCNVTGSSYCTAAYGTVLCSCPFGYSGDGFGSKGCIDRNECADHPCAAVATCTNYPGYYKCECPYGYSGLGDTQGGTIPGCEDIDECQTSYPCDLMAGATCLNFPGYYQCVCPTGYEGNGLNKERFANSTSCTDINECELSTPPCSSVASCTNTPGAYDCKCNDGYTGDGIGEFGCFDVNECDNSPCSPNASCMNTDGAYECKCNAGYSGNGKGSDGCTLGGSEAPSADSSPVTPIAKVSSGSVHDVLVMLLGAIIVIITMC